mmetsp:Transcript_267/g.647  ORF Transcript_267/g.647 Transcript_267/m.647 type:complete len:99 (-) Transcript_267:1055-1351(-)
MDGWNSLRRQKHRTNAPADGFLVAYREYDLIAARARQRNSSKHLKPPCQASSWHVYTRLGLANFTKRLPLELSFAVYFVLQGRSQLKFDGCSRKIAEP